MNNSDQFESIWPDDAKCPCGRDDAARGVIVGACVEESTKLHQALVAKGVCPIMMPAAIGMIAALLLGLQEQITAGSQEVAVLRMPLLQSRLDACAAAAKAMVNSANEVAGCA